MIRFFLSVSLLVSTSLQAQTYDFTHYGPRLSSDYQLDLGAFLPPDRLSLQEIQERLPQLSGYEDFLDFLAERRPVLFQNVVLIHDSGSLQYSDRDHPRVILFGDGLMLAFAEDPRRTERTVEVLAFNGRNFTAAELRFKQNTAHFEAQPRNCESCHGSPMKPLWDPYDFWPNAYGSAISRFGKDIEKTAYEKIRQQTPKKGIYNRISWPVPTSSFANGLPGIETFTQYVNQLQIFATIQHWKEQSPSFKPVIPALLAALNHCAEDKSDELAAQKMAAFFPESWRNRIQSNFPAFHKKVQEARRRLKSYQVARYQELFPGGKTLFNVDHNRLAHETQIVAQLHMALELAGVDARDFSLSQGLNPYFLSVPSNSDFDLATDFTLVAKELFQKLNPTISNLGDKYGYGWTIFNCQQLQQESVQQLQSVKMTTAAASAFKPAPTVFGECMNCHSVEAAKNGIPPIPFDRTAALRHYLQTGGMKKITDRISRSGGGQMPPYRSLNAQEKELFRLNLEQIAE